MSTKQIIILAGPNGAGKTTFAREYLPGEAAIRNFVNADLIAEGLAPFAPEQVAVKAGRIMIEMIRNHASQGRNFAFETTLAGRNYSRSIPQWRAAGYHVTLIFLSLRSADLAVARVAERVRQGGHGIAEHVIRRRFDNGWQNFATIYKHIVNAWTLYDNSGEMPIRLDGAQHA